MINRLKSSDLRHKYFIAFRQNERNYLYRLAHRSRIEDRRLCLEHLDNNWQVRKNRKFVLNLADELVLDNRVRVRAMFLISYFGEYPQGVWPIVEKYATHPNWHIRHQLAASVLEVLLAEHHAAYFPRVRAKILGGDKRFLDTLTHCWPFGQPKKQWDKTVRLIRDAGGDMTKVYWGGKYTNPAV